MRHSHRISIVHWQTRHLFVLMGLIALVAAFIPTSSASALETEFRVDTITVTATRLADDTVMFEYTGSDGSGCGFEALYISNPAGPVVTFTVSPIPRDALLTALDVGVWVAFRTQDCGGNTGDFGSRGLAGQIRLLDVGESSTVHAATFGDCSTPPSENCFDPAGSNASAIVYYSEDSVASAQFGDGNRGIRVYMREAIRDDASYNSLWVRIEAYDYGSFVWCNGATDASGVNSYAFGQNGAYVDADIEVWCSGTSQMVHVEAIWDAVGQPYINTVTTSGYDELLEQNTTHVVRYVVPTVSAAALSMDIDLLSGVPDFAYGEISMMRQHGVQPKGDSP